MKQPLSFHYNEETDVLTIEGINYHGDLFRAWGHELPLDVWFRIVNRSPGIIMLEKLREPSTDSPT